MTHVVFVAPHFLENTLRYLDAFASLTEAEVSVISEDVQDKLPFRLRERLAGHYQVKNSLDAHELLVATRAIQKGVGKVDRLVSSLEQLQLPLAMVREKVGIEGMWTQAATRFRDKDRMKEALRAAGVPVARSALARSMGDLVAFVREVGFPIVVKPPSGLGAKATYRVSDADELAALPRAGVSPSPEQPVQAEEFVRGREHTCETVTIDGEPVWRSGTRYFPGPLEVLETPWIQYCVLLPREAEDPTFTRFHPINTAALKALGMGTGISHMEWFLVGEDRMLVNEVGARPPGVHIMPMMSLAHETDMVRAWAELVTLDRFRPVPRLWAAGTAFFRGQGKGDRVRAVHGIEKALEEVGEHLAEVKWPRPGQARSSSYEGEGHAIVKHVRTDGAKHALKRLIETVYVELG